MKPRVRAEGEAETEPVKPRVKPRVRAEGEAETEAVAEIAKASNREACSVPAQAEAYHKHVKFELSNLERKTVNKVDDGDHSSLEEDADKYKEELEAVFFKPKESKSYRQTVGSISSISISCITAATPLLSSLKQTTCLIALDIVEHLRKWKNPINWRQEPGRSL
ncbi:Armadillo-like helical [Artemisia annua]|uniref:Armadillo-like helical n=1 Tax=Artemisia annua TaxID=35608 RepID=A0A2U1PXT1_ARTAN|nr:Armadillo-like helical [Artemisia annua]